MRTLLLTIGILSCLGLMTCAPGSAPKNNSVSKSNTAREYLACGCGCCGGVPKPTKFTCVAGTAELNKIIENDRKDRSPKQCATVGCSRGRLYRICP